MQADRVRCHALREKLTLKPANVTAIEIGCVLRAENFDEALCGVQIRAARVDASIQRNQEGLERPEQLLI